MMTKNLPTKDIRPGTLIIYDRAAPTDHWLSEFIVSVQSVGDEYSNDLLKIVMLELQLNEINVRTFYIRPDTVWVHRSNSIYVTSSAKDEEEKASS